MIAATVGNSQGGKKGGGTYKPTDFFPLSGRKRRSRVEVTPDDVTAGWDAWARLAQAAQASRGRAPTPG